MYRWQVSTWENVQLHLAGGKMQIKATMRYNFILTYCQKFESSIILIIISCQDVITADDYINHFSSKTENVHIL